MIGAASMTMEQICSLLDCTVLVDPGGLNGLCISRACGADLMSEVLAFTKADALLLTGLTNAQTVRTAEVADLKAVIFVRNKEPQADAVELARHLGLPLLRTALPMFEACGRLYAAGLPGCSGESSLGSATDGPDSGV